MILGVLGILGTALAGCGASHGGANASRAPASAGTANQPGRTPSAGVTAGGASSGIAKSPSPAPASSAAGSAPSLGETVSPAQPDIIQTGDIALRVRHGALQQVVAQVTGLTTGSGGFVSDSNQTAATTTTAPSAQLTLRIPDNALNGAVADITRLGTVTSEQLHGSDVTGQVVDLGAQIVNLQSEEQAVRLLLARAQAIGDILTIQNQLFSLQGQIQQLTGQRDGLDAQVAYANLSVELTEATAAPGPAPHRHPSALSRAWSLAGHHTVAVLRGVVLVVGWLAPLLVLGLAAGLALLWRWRRRRPAPQGERTEPGALS